ncbi:hypothetical protein OESDEN_21601, partial [Oesophagostomum dentatum]
LSRQPRPPTEAPTEPPEIKEEEELVTADYTQLITTGYEEPQTSQPPVEDLAPPELTTQKYVLNEDAAEKYWATASFVTTAASPVEPQTEAANPVEEIPEVQPVTNPPEEPTTEYIPVEETTAAPPEPMTEVPAPVIPEEQLTTLPPTVPVPVKKPEVEMPEKPMKKPLMPTILGGKGIVIEKKEHKKYWIHKPFEHPKNIGHWHSLRPCVQKKPTEKPVDCLPAN